MKTTMTLIAAALVAFGAFDAGAAGFGASSTPASSTERRAKARKPKQAKYTKLRAALEAAKDWEQPVVVFVLKDGDDASTLLKQKVLTRKELVQGFWATNCVLCAINAPTNPRNRNEIDETRLDKESAKLLAAVKEKMHGLNPPYAVVADAAGKPLAKASEYVVDVGVGPWLASLQAAFNEAKYPFFHTKESSRLVSESKPDGKSKKR